MGRVAKKAAATCALDTVMRLLVLAAGLRRAASSPGDSHRLLLSTFQELVRFRVRLQDRRVTACLDQAFDSSNSMTAS